MACRWALALCLSGGQLPAMLKEAVQQYVMRQAVVGFPPEGMSCWEMGGFWLVMVGDGDEGETKRFGLQLGMNANKVQAT